MLRGLAVFVRCLCGGRRITRITLGGTILPRWRGSRRGVDGAWLRGGLARCGRGVWVPLRPRRDGRLCGKSITGTA